MEARPTPSTSSILGILGPFLRNYPQPPTRHGDLTLKIILNSSRESAEYNTAIRSLLSSESIQKSLQRLSDDSAIERMLDVLDMVSMTRMHFSVRALIQQTIRPKGGTGSHVQERPKEGLHPSSKDVQETW